MKLFIQITNTKNIFYLYSSNLRTIDDKIIRNYFSVTPQSLSSKKDRRSSRSKSRNSINEKRHKINNTTLRKWINKIMLQTYRNDSSSRSRENDSYIKFYDYSSRFIPTQTTQFTTNPMRESKMSNKGGTWKDKLWPTDYFRDYVTSPNNLIHHMSKRTQDLSSKTRNNLIESGIDKLHPHYMKFGTKRSPNNRGKLHTLFEFQTMKPSEEYRLYQNAEVWLVYILI